MLAPAVVTASVIATAVLSGDLAMALPLIGG